MDYSISREELLKYLSARISDPELWKSLEPMSDAQLRVVAHTLDDLERWKPDRRSEPRKSQTRRVRVFPADGNTFPSQEGLQEDLSNNGIGIYLNRPIPVGARLRVHASGRDLFGTVRRCRPDKGGFAVGILFDHPLDSPPPPTSA